MERRCSYARTPSNRANSRARSVRSRRDRSRVRHCAQSLLSIACAGGDSDLIGGAPVRASSVNSSVARDSAWAKNPWIRMTHGSHLRSTDSRFPRGRMPDRPFFANAARRFPSGRKSTCCRTGAGWEQRAMTASSAHCSNHRRGRSSTSTTGRSKPRWSPPTSASRS